MSTFSSTKKTRNWILALLFLGWSLGNIDRYIMNYAVINITNDLNLSPSSTGLLLSSFFAGYAIMQIPGGWLSDKIGPRKVLIGSVIMWSIFTALTGAAWSLASIVIIRFLFGIGEGGFQPASSKVISLSFPVKERSRAMSVMLSSGGIVGLFIPLLSAHLLLSIGWRTMFVVIGIIGALVAVLYYWFIKLPKSQSVESASSNSNGEKGSFKTLLKTPIMWNLFFAYFSIYAINWGLASWLPTYLVTKRGLDLISLGWLQIIPGITTILGIYLSGYIIDKLPKGIDKIAGSISCLFVGVLLYLMFNAGSVTTFMVYQTIIVVFISFVSLLLPSIILKSLPTTVTGSAMGFANTGGQLAGFITPMAIGFMVDAFDGSFKAAFWMLIGFAVLCIVALLTINYNKGEMLKAAELENSTV